MFERSAAFLLDRKVWAGEMSIPPSAVECGNRADFNLIDSVHAQAQPALAESFA